MLCRVADSIFWMSRYVERIENASRFIAVTLQAKLDAGQVETQLWQPLIELTGDESSFRDRFGSATEEHAIDFLTFDQSNSNAISELMRRARENARSVRDAISSEMWEQLNQFHLELQATSLDEVLESPEQFFIRVRMAALAFHGVLQSTLTRNDAYHFANLGQMMERADQIARLVSIKTQTLQIELPGIDRFVDDLGWANVLHAASGYEMYRQQHRQIQPEKVVGFLLSDAGFPRSIRHCLDTAVASLSEISESVFGEPEVIPAFHQLSRLQTELAEIEPTDQFLGDVVSFLTRFQTSLTMTIDEIHSSFMASNAA